MPINGGAYGNYVQRRMNDAATGRGDRLRNVLNQRAQTPAFGGGGGGDRRNRGNASSSAAPGSFSAGNVDPSAKVTLSTRGGNATANASGSNIRKGDVPVNANIQLDASGANATANASGKNGRAPVSFATYADQNNPMRSPAPSHDIPGFRAASQEWSTTAGRALDARNQQHQQAGAEHDRRMKDYNDAVRNASALGQPNAAGYGSRPGDRTNSGPGGGRDTGGGRQGQQPQQPMDTTPPPPGQPLTDPMTGRVITTPENAPGNLAPNGKPVPGYTRQGQQPMNGYPPVGTLPLPGTDNPNGPRSPHRNTGPGGGRDKQKNTMNGYPNVRTPYPTGSVPDPRAAMTQFEQDPAAANMSFSQWLAQHPEWAQLLQSVR